MKCNSASTMRANKEGDSAAGADLVVRGVVLEAEGLGAEAER